MKLGRTIVFILLFVMAAAVYMYQTRLSKESLTFVPDEVNRSVVISREDGVDRIELRDHVRKSEIVIRKEKGLWQLEVPVHYPAENQVAEGLVAAARMVSKQPRLRADKEWGEYGLAKPELEITLGRVGKKPAKLLIGSPTPIGKSVFAKWDEERGYFLLPSEMKAAFQQSVYGLREKRIFRASPEVFRKISVEMGKHSYQWVKDRPPEKQDEARPSSQGGGQWYWFEPVAKFGQKVPPGQLESVLGILRGLHVKEFQDNNKKSKAELGFFMIHDRIRVDLDEGSPEKQAAAPLSPEGGRSQTFYFGNEVPQENAYYGLREGENTVFFVDRGKVIELLDILKTVKAEGEEQKTEGFTPSAILHPSS